MLILNSAGNVCKSNSLNFCSIIQFRLVCAPKPHTRVFKDSRLGWASAQLVSCHYKVDLIWLPFTRQAAGLSTSEFSTMWSPHIYTCNGHLYLVTKDLALQKMDDNLILSCPDSPPPTGCSFSWGAAASSRFWPIIFFKTVCMPHIRVFKDSIHGLAQLVSCHYKIEMQQMIIWLPSTELLLLAADYLVSCRRATK